MNLNLQNGLSVRADNVKGWNGEFVDGTALKEGDWVFLDTVIQEGGVDIDPGLAYLIGYIYGDGHVNDIGTVEVLWRKEQSNRDELVYLTDKFLTSTLHEFQRPGCQRMEDARKYKCGLFRDGWVGLKGKSALEKYVCSEVFGWSSFCKGQFIAGLFDSDGCVSDTGYVCLTSASKDLVSSVQMVLWSLGIYSVIRQIKSPSTLRSGSGLLFHLMVNSLTSRKQFQKWCEPHLDYKRDCLKEMCKVEANGNSERHSLVGLSEYVKEELKKEHLKFHPQQNGLRNLRMGRVSLVSLRRLYEYAPDWVGKRKVLLYVIRNSSRMEKVVSLSL